MYLTKTKVKRGEKSQTEEYIVVADTPTLAEAILTKELEGTTIEKQQSMSELKVQDVFESGGGTFYEIKLDYPSDDGTKTIRETYIQEELEDSTESVVNKFRTEVNFGTIRSIKELKVLGILK